MNLHSVGVTMLAAPAFIVAALLLAIVGAIATTAPFPYSRHAWQAMVICLAVIAYILLAVTLL